MKRILAYIEKGSTRTVKLKKNVTFSFFIKGISILVGFVLVPLTLGYLDKTKYGIWLTLASFLNWLNFFEIGLGSGLKNKLAESLAKNDVDKGKKYISTTYAILSLIIAGVLLVFVIVHPFISWHKILNTNPVLESELSLLAFVVFIFFFLRFVLKLISIILYADQRPAIANSFGPIGNVVALIIIFILTKSTSGSLLYLGITLSFCPVFILLLGTIYFFNTDYKIIRPAFKSVDFKYAKPLFNLGLKFFFIQISMLILFQSSRFIIAQFFGPEEVIPFHIAYKLFSTINMVFTIIITPLWSAFTEAYVKKDVKWIQKTIRYMQKLWFGMVIFTVFLLLGSKWIYTVWVGEEIVIPFRLSLFIAIYFVLFTFGGLYNMFINGIGRIKLQLICLVIGALTFVPLCFLFVKVLNFGIEGVVLATIVANFYSPLVAPLHYRYIMKELVHEAA